MRVVRKVCEIGRAVEETFKVSEDAYLGLVKAYALLDEKGEIIRPPNNPHGFTVPDEKADEWKKSCDTFMDTQTPITLKWGKLTLDDVAKVGLTPEDLEALSFMVE